MPRGRSAISVHSDSSDMDIDALAEAEMSKLQRQFRIMEGDRQAYSVQSQELIRKQRLEIEKLRKEHEELQKNLRVSESQSRKQADSHDTQQLRTLLNRRNELEQQLERERLGQAELEREIQSIQKKLEVLRKGDVGTFHSQKSQALHIQKATSTLENKLDRALIRFNQQLVKNSQLREELETLRVERVRFQQLHRKLEKELQEIRREIGDVIGMSTAAYDA
ncbi:coiled-coil domain-containing protein 114 isoform X1, partial [Tachysurus ichikawai]